MLAIGKYPLLPIVDLFVPLFSSLPSSLFYPEHICPILFILQIFKQAVNTFILSGDIRKSIPHPLWSGPSSTALIIADTQFIIDPWN